MSHTAFSITRSDAPCTPWAFSDNTTMAEALRYFMEVNRTAPFAIIRVAGR